MHRHLPALFLLAVAAPAVHAQDYRFSQSMSAGSELTIENVSGTITVSQARGTTAEIEVTKRVRRGDGNLVKAIMETERGNVTVCTIYLSRDRNRNSCEGSNSTDGERLEVSMDYVVRIPRGVELTIENVNGAVTLGEISNTVEIDLVNGDINGTVGGGVEAELVNGSVDLAVTGNDLGGSIDITVVNGSVTLSLPRTVNARVSASTVNGRIETGGFEMNVAGRWGPRSASARLGNGAGSIEIETVNGGITFRRR